MALWNGAEAKCAIYKYLTLCHISRKHALKLYFSEAKICWIYKILQNQMDFPDAFGICGNLCESITFNVNAIMLSELFEPGNNRFLRVLQ